MVKARVAKHVVVGAGAGLLAGLMGVGGGLVLVPALVGYLGLSPRMAIGTSLTAMAPIAIAGSLTYAMAGKVDWGLAFLLALGSSLGMVAGAKVMNRVPTSWLQKAFGALLIFLALRFVTGTL